MEFRKIIAVVYEKPAIYFLAENCALMGYYAASVGNFLPTFQDILSFPYTGFKKKSRRS
jgi:hypothetical protein